MGVMDEYRNKVVSPEACRASDQHRPPDTREELIKTAEQQGIWRCSNKH